MNSRDIKSEPRLGVDQLTPSSLEQEESSRRSQPMAISAFRCPVENPQNVKMCLGRWREETKAIFYWGEGEFSNDTLNDS